MDLSRRISGQLLKRPRLGEARPKTFILPFVIRVSGDAEEARFLGDRFAGNLGQDVSHWQLQLLAHIAQKPLPARLRGRSEQLVEHVQLFSCHGHFYCPSLFSGGRPSAVPRLIVTIVVTPINGQPFWS
jgi:hypothetical protein